MQLATGIRHIAKKKHYYGLAAAVILGIVGVVVWKGFNPATAAEEITLVRTTVVSDVSANDNYTYSGEVRGRYESQLGFQISGKIVSRNIELGKKVRAGEALLQLDPKDSQQTVNVSAAQVYSANSQLALAESNLKRYQRLYEQHAISRMQYDQMENAYNAAVAAARQADAQYTQGANQLGYTTLFADADGVIASIDAEVGQVVSAGQSVVTLVRDGELEVEVNVPENRIEEVRKAQQVKVSFWALPKVEVSGKIREISPIADKVTRTYKIRVSLLKKLPEIKLGMTASVSIADDKQKSAIYVPVSAIYQDQGAASVWVITGNVVNLRQVTLGAIGDNKVQVLAGLKPGETIVTAGVHKLREGQKVRTTAGDGQ